MPASNFTQDGLARMFGMVELSPTAHPPDPTLKKNAIIAGSVCGAFGLGLLIALGCYLGQY